MVIWEDGSTHKVLGSHVAVANGLETAKTSSLMPRKGAHLGNLDVPPYTPVIG